jgi:hypothetical protein
MNDANFMRKRDQKELEKSEKLYKELKEKHHWLSDRLYNNRIEDRD